MKFQKIVFILCVILSFTGYLYLLSSVSSSITSSAVSSSAISTSVIFMITIPVFLNWRCNGFRIYTFSKRDPFILSKME